MIFSRLRTTVQRHPRAVKIFSLLATSALLVAVVFFTADRVLAEPMRRHAETLMNAKLVGYTIRIGRAHPHLWRLGLDLDLESVVLTQTTHPDPPVADFGALEFSMRWREPQSRLHGV